MRSDAAANRERLISAAEQVFATHGAGATLDDVARAARSDLRLFIAGSPIRRHWCKKCSVVLPASDALAETQRGRTGGRCLAMFLQTVGVELAEKAGLAAPVGESSHPSLSSRTSRRSAALLARAQQAGAVRADVTAPTSRPRSGLCVASSEVSAATQRTLVGRCGAATFRLYCAASAHRPRVGGFALTALGVRAKKPSFEAFWRSCGLVVPGGVEGWFGDPDGDDAGVVDAVARVDADIVFALRVLTCAHPVP